MITLKNGCSFLCHYTNRYSDETRAKVAQYAIDHGVPAACAKWSDILGEPVPESTARNWVSKYKAMSESGQSVEKISMSKMGRPLKVPADVDGAVQKHLHAVGQKGGNISGATAVETCGAILATLYPRLAEMIKLTKSWSQSLFRRMKFVQRKVTKAARHPPADPAEVKDKFVKEVNDYRVKHDIPKRLTLNADQTGVFMTPCKRCTMAPRGAKQVKGQGFDDKRGITMLLTGNMNGGLLPPQVIYEGKTNRCHPQHMSFPEDWHITHSPSHWSNIDTMHQYLENILIPYVNGMRDQIRDPDQKALLILDVFAPHRDETFKAACKAANIKVIYVPAGCTSDLQPLDAEGSVNAALKLKMANEFSSYYQGEIFRHIADNGGNPNCDGFRPDTTISRLKPLHARWMVKAFKDLQTTKETVKLGWRKSGLRT